MNGRELKRLSNDNTILKLWDLFSIDDSLLFLEVTAVEISILTKIIQEYLVASSQYVNIENQVCTVAGLHWKV